MYTQRIDTVNVIINCRGSWKGLDNCEKEIEITLKIKYLDPSDKDIIQDIAKFNHVSEDYILKNHPADYYTFITQRTSYKVDIKYLNRNFDSLRATERLFSTGDEDLFKNIANDEKLKNLILQFDDWGTNYFIDKSGNFVDVDFSVRRMFLKKRFIEDLINEADADIHLCDSCYLKEEKRPKEGQICTQCGKIYEVEVYGYAKISFCEECGSEIKFRNYCHQCSKKTYTKFCTNCGEKIYLANEQ